ncbi:MAG TPA: hypothetical protein VN512_02875 [Clostridia bacterium]|nr:hypothetical protein [Clostridia bacterium]
MKQEQFDRFLSELRSEAEPPPEAKWFLFFSRFFHILGMIGAIGVIVWGVLMEASMVNRSDIVFYVVGALIFYLVCKGVSLMLKALEQNIRRTAEALHLARAQREFLLTLGAEEVSEDREKVE